LQIGPFSIEKKLEFDNYKLRLPESMKIHPIFHISLLIPTTNPTTRDNINVSDELYEVEAILDKRTANGQTEYLVKWKGYGNGDSTWEPPDNLNCPERVKDFTKRRSRNLRDED
jgi:hypothetical protein